MENRILVKRTFVALAGPVALWAVAFVLPAVGLGLEWQQVPGAAKGTWDPSVFVWCGCFAAVMGAIVESEVRVQLRLAREGREAEAIIDEMKQRTVGRDHAMVWYHFTTEAGEMVEGKCFVSQLDSVTMERGSKMGVYYDGERPRRNRLVQRMWGVEWVEETARV
jgi:hypothetical protein